MRVGDVMTKDVITIGPDVTVHKAARLMTEHRVSALPVVDAGGSVVGIVSEGDLILGQAAPPARRWWQRLFADPDALARDYQKAAGTTVADVMTRPVVSVTPGVDIATAARLLIDRGLRRLPVVRDGALVGILARGDLVKALASTPVFAVWAPDETLVATMRERMRAEPWTSPSILVEAHDGIIELSGVAASDVESEALETMARGVPGCRGVVNRLVAEVVLPQPYGM